METENLCELCGEPMTVEDGTVFRYHGYTRNCPKPPLKTISPDSFAMICFLVLMQNGEGLIDKSPDYITEKMYILRSGIEAFGALDIYNMRKAIEWCNEWKIRVPQEVADEMRRQNDAEKKLDL